MEFNVNPYYDDFEATGGPKDSNYMRILFRPGYAVQARELTQIQSILQNQIKQFGDHIFKDGSPVIGGQLSLDTNVKSIKLEPQYNLEDIVLSDFNGKLIRDTGSENKRAQVIAIDDTQTYPTMMIRYLRGNEFVDGETIQDAVDGALLAQLIATSSQTTGSVVSINEGVFYVDGYFVHVPEQTIVLDPYSKTPSFRVGLQIEEAIVNESQDSTLLDPAQGSFNYQAPGADRYQFSLVLAARTLDSTDDSTFFELLRVENGIITQQVIYPIYSEIEKTLARRTYDESGDYTVRPFRVTPVANTSNTALFDYQIEPGKAYVKGFEFETIGTQKITANKARTTSNSADYDLSLEYGNYVAVANLFSGNTGFIDTSSFGTIDLHTVPVANINTAGVAGYSNTKIGTARVRNLFRKGDNTHYIYLLDTNTAPKVVNAAAGSANTITLPATFSTYDNAYANVDITIVAGPALGDSRRIVSYVGSTKVATVDRPFSATPTTATRVSLNYGIKDIDSIAVTPATYSANVYGGQSAANAVYAAADIDNSSKTIAGNTFFEGTTTNRLLFKFPESYIAQNQFVNVDYYTRKLISGASFASGNLTISVGSGLTSNESFYFGSDGSYLSDASANANFTVLVKDKGTSNTANGVLIDLARNGAGVFRTTANLATIQSGYTGNFTADVFVNVKVNDTEITYRRTKTLYGNTSNTTLRTTDAPANGTAVTGLANVKIDSANAIVWFTNTNDIVKAPGTKQSLYLPDVIKIIKIYVSGNNSVAPNTTNAIDVTDRYLFDSGQTDNYYDHGSIMLKDTATPPVGQMAVMCQFYDHSATTGYFNADSYSTDAYENNLIPFYNSRSMGRVNLRDVIDFRPTRTKGTTAFTLSGVKIPDPNYSMELTYGFYLPRIDKVVATQDKEFKVLTGTPGFNPKAPSDLSNAMTLYTVYIPPYVSDVRDIKMQYIENKRYTMRDIGRLEKRIEQVEYYTALSLLEQSARNQTVLYEDGVLEKEKYGILVEQFDGWDIADGNNPDFLCSISFNELKPYVEVNSVAFTFKSNSQPYTLNSKTYTLPYTQSPIVVQNTATKSISVQPYLFAQFAGQTVLAPETDYWISTVLTPAVVPGANTGAPPPGTGTTDTNTGSIGNASNGTATWTGFVGSDAVFFTPADPLDGMQRIVRPTQNLK